MKQEKQGHKTDRDISSASLSSVPGAARELTRLILVCFFLSGFTGLIYEILWTRMLVKVIGGTPFAVSIVLTVFMAGLGLGSVIAGRRIDKVQDPMRLVRMYGLLELAVGAYGLFLPLLLVGFRPLYAVLYNRLFDQFWLYHLLTFAGCGLLLLVPVICMGATLPILCRFYVVRLSHVGAHVGRLYGLNTIGAALGALLCGFLLIGLLGVQGTLLLAVLFNALIGLACISASRRALAGRTKKDQQRLRRQQRRAAAHAEGAEAKAALLKGAVPTALMIFMVSGFCAMAYEVIWTRLLSLLIGPTTYSFTIVLVTFITCLALGSMLFGWWSDRTRGVLQLLVYTQLAAALLALLASQVMGNSQFFFGKLIYQYQDAFGLRTLLQALVLFLLMLPATVCLGATFPLVGKIYTRSVSRIGGSIGRAYALNTTGAVLGSFCTGFLLIPLLGKENGLRCVVGLQVTTVLLVLMVLFWLNHRSKQRLIPVLICGVLGIVLCMHFPSWNRRALCHGRYQRWKIIEDDLRSTGWAEALYRGPAILDRWTNGEVLYYGDGIGGFTAVVKLQNMFGTVHYNMLNSGKADASTLGDVATQTLLAHLPMMMHADPKHVMVLGLASGMTAGEVLCYPVEHVDILEISPEVVEASEFFRPWNNGVLEDPRTELIVQDGRAHLQLTERMYDVIISEPSNPWMAGLATLFTQEMFTLAKQRLNEGGIFSQFLHSYQMDLDTFLLVCRTFAEVFPDSVLVQTIRGDFVLIGFKGSRPLLWANTQKRLVYAQRSANIVIPDHRCLLALAVSEDVVGLAGTGPLNNDNWPQLELSAPKIMYIDDPKIREHIVSFMHVGPDIRQAKLDIAGNIDLQIDFVQFQLSLHSMEMGVIPDIENVSAAQRERLRSLITTYARDYPIDYSIINTDMQHMCREIQIQSIREHLDQLVDPGTRFSAHCWLAMLYQEDQQYDMAEYFYRQALELRPEDVMLYSGLGSLLFSQGKYEQARTLYIQGLQRDPDNVILKRNLRQTER